MNDLINRKALINFLDGQIKDVSESKTDLIFTKDVLKAMRTTGEAVKKYVNHMPIAYDVDKVVETLDKDAQMLYSMQAFEPIKAWQNDYLIPIVKSGGNKTLMDILQEGAVKDE